MQGRQKFSGLGDIEYLCSAPPTGCHTVTNTASIVSFDQADSNATNNSNSADVQVNCDTNPKLDLELTKTAGSSQGVLGDTVVYTLTVSNNGPDAATNVVVTDALPSAVSYVSATGGTSVSESHGVVT